MKHGKRSTLVAVLLSVTLGSTAYAGQPEDRELRPRPTSIAPDVVLAGGWQWDARESAIQGHYCQGTGRIAVSSSASGLSWAAAWEIPYADKLLSTFFTKPAPAAKPKAEAAASVTFKAAAGWRAFHVVAAVVDPGQSSRLIVRRDTEIVANVPMQRNQLYPLTVDMAGAQAVTLHASDAGHTVFCGPQFLRREGRL